MNKPSNRIFLCLAHMSEDGVEQKYIKKAFDDNYVVPLGPNVNQFEQELEAFVNETTDQVRDDDGLAQIANQARNDASVRHAGPDPASLAQGTVGLAQIADQARNDASVRHAGPDPASLAQGTVDLAQIADQARNDASVRHAGPDPASLAQGTVDLAQIADQARNDGGLSKRVVALSCGTAAVHLALINCGVQAGDEVLVQSFTFCASSHPITYLGAKPVFVGSEKDTWNMDPDLLEAAIIDRKAKTGKYPKAIVPVALYGMPYDCCRIMVIADKYGIPVIEDAAEGFGSKFNGRVLGTFGKFGVLSFNGNKMITTSGGGALITEDADAWREVMMYATQYRESYPYYQHEKIGYNYRMSNICAGIGIGQMTVAAGHIAHHRHIADLYEKAFAAIPGIEFHKGPDWAAEGSNYWLNTITIDPSVHVIGQENAYASIVTGAVGGAAGVIHAASSAHTDCEPNANVEAMRVFLDKAGIEARPLWKPMHKQPVYAEAPVYTNDVEVELFKIGMCLPSGPCVTDDDVAYIIETIRKAIA